jgi:hypothetical protein
MGAWCEDPWLKEIRGWGYVPVLLPKTGLAPLRVLKRRDKELNDIGSLLDLFVPGEVPAPEPRPEEKSPDRGRVESGKLKIGFGLHFLHGALEVLGVSGAPRAEHRSAKSLRFTAEDIGISKVDLVPLDCACRKSHPGYATRRYSLIMPPTRVCLRTRYCSRTTGCGSGFSGAAASSERCGRC